MFNCKYDLTKAVLEGRKTMTRRIVPNNVLNKWDGFSHLEYPVRCGEVLAIAQAYEEIGRDDLSNCPGYRNKMFVRPALMHHFVRIKGLKIERLQDINEEDVYKEGFIKEFVNNGWGNAAYHEEAVLTYYDDKGRTKQIRDKDPKVAFSMLIDKISGAGTWDWNPWVYVYEFELTLKVQN